MHIVANNDEELNNLDTTIDNNNDDDDDNDGQDYVGVAARVSDNDDDYVGVAARASAVDTFDRTSVVNVPPQSGAYSVGVNLPDDPTYDNLKLNPKPTF